MNRPILFLSHYLYSNPFIKISPKILILFLILFIDCTNFSVTKNQTVPPILVSLTLVTTSTVAKTYQLNVRTSNTAFFFAGFRLYTASTESGARNPADLTTGTTCGIGALPNQPLESLMEISPSPGNISGTICTFQVTLTSGQYIAMRSLLVSIQPGPSRVYPSAPSNALIVP